jgi:hypothetical protein
MFCPVQLAVAVRTENVTLRYLSLYALDSPTSVLNDPANIQFFLPRIPVMEVQAGWVLLTAGQAANFGFASLHILQELLLSLQDARFSFFPVALVPGSAVQP